MTAKPNPFIKKAVENVEAEKRAKRDNPFLKPPAGKERVKPKGPVRMTEEQWDELRMQSQRIIAEKGIKVGDRVKVTWEYDRAYGPGTAVHEGIVSELDDWIKCKPFSTTNGVLHLPLTSVKSIERIEKLEPDAPPVKTTPSVTSPAAQKLERKAANPTPSEARMGQKRPNPFMKKAQA